MRTWQSRLSAKLNKLSQKLVDNSITNAGLVTDCIFIRTDLDKVGDPTRIQVSDIDVAELIFPAMVDIPMKRFLGNNGQMIEAIDATEEKTEPFECYSRIDTPIDQGSIFLKFFENPTGSSPLVLPLKVAEILGNFGARSIIFNKLHLTYYDNPLDPQIYQWCLDLATRRSILGW
jgi:hypothetical protein